MTDEQWSSQTPPAPPEIEGADAVWPQLMDYIQLDSATGSSAVLSASMRPPGASGQDGLSEGTAASSASEVVLDENAAEALEVAVGDAVVLPADHSASGAEHRFTVVGIAPAPTGAVFGGTPQILVSEANAEALLGPTAGAITDRWLASVSRGNRSSRPSRHRPRATGPPCAPSTRPRRSPPRRSCAASGPSR